MVRDEIRVNRHSDGNASNITSPPLSSICLFHTIHDSRSLFLFRSLRLSLTIRHPTHRKISIPPVPSTFRHCGTTSVLLDPLSQDSSPLVSSFLTPSLLDSNKYFTVLPTLPIFSYSVHLLLQGLRLFILVQSLHLAPSPNLKIHPILG